MKSRQVKREGFTLVEAMVATSVIVIAAIGSLAYQYFGVKHIRIANAELAATRIGQLLIEDWKSTGGSTEYDPMTLGMDFAAPEAGELGAYTITVDGLKMYVFLEYENVAVDDFAGVTLREITVTIRWRSDFAPGGIEDDGPGVVLTSYVRCDRD
jgi:type II secretory pathway pseudopilin PulG